MSGACVAESVSSAAVIVDYGDDLVTLVYGD